MSVSAVALSWSSFFAGAFIGAALTGMSWGFVAYKSLAEENQLLTDSVGGKIEQREVINERERELEKELANTRSLLAARSGCPMSDADHQFVKLRESAAKDFNSRTARREEIHQNRLRREAAKTAASD